MKILHIENTSGVAAMIAKGERALGHHADVLETWKAPNFQYEHDISNFYEGSFCRKLKAMRKTFNIARDYDIIHVHGGMPRNRIDYIWMKIFKRMPMVVHYHGCETRNGYGMHYQNLADTKIVATPDLLDFHPGSVFIANPARPMGASWPEGELRFVHLPTTRGNKGTGDILDAVEHLKADGRHVNFNLVEKVPHAQALKEIAASNVVIDQVNLTLEGAKAGLLGMVSLEGMAMGKAVVNSMSMDPEGFGHYYPPGYPGIYADEDTIEEVIESLMDDPEEARRRGEMGRKWISENLTPEIIARRHVEIYNRLLEEA